MPSISCSSKLRAVSDHYSLNLNARHRLVVGTPSDTLYPTNKTRFPECVDVRLSSNLVVTLSGRVDGSEIPAIEIIASSLAQHFVDYLQTNANYLGLNTISQMWIDDDDGLLKLTLTSSRQYPFKPELLPVHVLLVGLDLCFSWKTSTPPVTGAQPQWESHPFSQHLSLPFRTLLDNAVGRFVTWQLVKRYPLIFGQWCQQLDTEASFFPPIFSSVLTIMKRSPNPAFRAKCQHLIKAIRRRHTAAVSEALSRLADHLLEIPDVDASSIQVRQPSLKDEDVLWLAMERVYRDGMRRRQFKGLVGPLIADRTDDEDLFQDHTLLPQHPTTIDEQLIWDDPSTKPPAYVWIDPFFFGDPTPSCNPSDMDMDMELNRYNQGPHDDVWDDPHDLSLDSGDDCQSTHSELNLNDNDHIFVSTDNDLQDNDCVIPTFVSDFSDEDLFVPLQLNFQASCPATDHEDFAESEIQHYLLNHAPTQADGYELNSEVMVEHGTELSPHAGVLPQSQVFYAITEPVSHQEDRGEDFSSQECDTLALKHPRSTPRSEFPEESPRVPPQLPDATLYYSNDIDMDLGMLSDTESVSSEIMQTAFGECCDLEEFDDVWVPSGLVLPGTDHSHPAATLLVTCPSKRYQLQYQEEGEDVEPRLEWDVEGTLDWGVSADTDTNARPMEDWGEDALLLMDF